MNKKMTAVEWLEEQMLNQDWYTYKSLEYIAKAKEMEKEQIIDASNQIEVIGLDHELPGEKYYNQTFNK